MRKSQRRRGGGEEGIEAQDSEKQKEVEVAFAGSAESARSVIDIWERVRVTAIPAAGFGGLSQKPLQNGQWGGNLRRRISSGGSYLTIFCMQTNGFQVYRNRPLCQPDLLLA